MSKIAMLGFGEAARAIVAGWHASNQGTVSVISTFDVKYDDVAQRPDIVEVCRDLRVQCAETVGEALAGSDAIFSLVTADRALDAAKSAGEFIRAGALYFDCNSCAPSTKKAASAAINNAGSRYVDVAVMAPIHPARHRTLMLLAGTAAEEAHRLLATLGMNTKVVGPEIGQASAIKMLRSVMIKGMEALTAECMLAARRAGVEEAVVASLQASDPGFDWRARSAYNLERMIVHGARRAAEMQEVANTLCDFGLPDRMTRAAVEWQRQIADLSLSASEGSLAWRADRILERLKP
ncbi:DUF1932 domain-containing protein [Pararhizobium sp. A13]|uniref:NAD(P)-dependent oxidoreductase n=1 Tax=Pararhizobium sp. A13 TaxID=3133975 RepID=UPI00311B2F34